MYEYRNSLGSFALRVVWEELLEQKLLDPAAWVIYAEHQLQDNRYLFEYAEGDNPDDSQVSDYSDWFSSIWSI